MARYLADSSIWAWARGDRRLDIKQKLAERFAADEIVTCPPVVLEVMHRARNGEEYEAVFADLFEPIDWLPLNEEVSTRAVEVQREIAGGTDGNHLRPAADYLIAAIAEHAGPEFTLWAFDKDLRIICEHTGQPFEAEDFQPNSTP
ncbi:MAG: PIN domain-containing protein [Solirubrobacterales bacterium]